MGRISGLRLTVGLVALAAALNETGFCWSRMRWLTDKEMIDIAVDSEIRNPHRANFYRSRADFYERNPNCCSIDRFSDDQRLPGAISAALGYRAALVELFFRQAVDAYHETPYYDVSMGISPCGSIGAWWGIDSSEGERPAAGRSWTEP